MRTIAWDDEEAEVKFIDQTLLPADYKIVACTQVDELIAAINELKVRGAPALGAAGAFGWGNCAVSPLNVGATLFDFTGCLCYNAQQGLTLRILAHQASNWRRHSRGSLVPACPG